MVIKKPLLLVIIGAIVTLLAIYLATSGPQAQLSVTDKINSSLSVEPTIEIPAGKLEPKFISKPAPTPATAQERAAGIIRSTVPDYTQDGSLMQNYDRLLKSYLNGNLDAGYTLAMDLVSCIGAPALEEELKEEIAGYDDLKEKLNLGMDYSVAAQEEHIEKRFHFCRDINNDAAELGMELLGETADKGHIPSQAQYGTTYPPTDIERYRGQVTDEELEIFKARQIRGMKFLKNATQHGSLRGLRAMISFKLNHDGKNLVEALAYNLAYLEFESEHLKINSFTKQRDFITNQLSPEEIEQAKELSYQHIQHILDNGTVFEP